MPVNEQDYCGADSDGDVFNKIYVCIDSDMVLGSHKNCNAAS